MSPAFAGGARFWGLALLGLGLPVCVALALRVPPDAAGPTLPGTLGLRAGAMLGLDPAGAARLGQGAAIAAFLALGLAALTVADRGREVLFALLGLPASLAAASGPDGPVLGLAALAAALLTPRPLTGRGRPWRLAGAALAIALAVLARPACAPLAGMLLVPFPPPRRLARFCRDRLPLAVLAVLPVLLGVPPAGGAPDPALAVPLPWPLYGLWAAALLVLPLALRRGPLPPPAERLWLVACALLGLWLMVLRQALGPAGGGLSPRDLLPLAPMLVLAFARGRIGTAATPRWPALLPVLAAAVDAVALPALAFRP
ncbi:hypothetical protein MMSR116_30955 [Methylobacterium mesophilicum SR1.6/6]|uniref:Uncharacterized protein n=1 Tax=Methylobacterium mesophilicum SR1.6/6 TaxID=908290 RepID=A0A6B9G1F6_9HYPH|nr:hypothetical protein [Methylobacterium mesophilicum]QGY05825.1 hypothetical protein MMSR116_30955 [Methylobacterium mesophilicum SR1.6/6]